MTTWAHSKVLSQGLNYIKTSADKVVAIKNYTAGDSYGAVTAAGNILAEAATVNGDYTIGAPSTGSSLTSPSGKTATAGAAGTPTHIGFLNSVGSEVLWVTNETSGLPISSGDTVTFPQLTYFSDQLVSA